MVDDLIKLCKKFNCQLAISIYHSNHNGGNDEVLRDLVEIPLKINSIFKGNIFFISSITHMRDLMAFFIVSLKDYL